MRTDDCKLMFSNVLEACEDMIIIGDEAFLACGNTAGRLQFYPGAGQADASKRTDWNEPAYKLDLKTRKLTKLQRVGYTGDNVLHGIDVWRFKDDPTRINIFFVNHIRDGSCVTIFEHKLGTDKLVFLRNACHSKIICPNAVTAVGPLEFYFTNDHKYKSGIMRHIEDHYGPFTGHDIGYCDASASSGTKCKTAYKGSLLMPNGIISIDDGSQILAADSLGGAVSRFSVNSANQKLKLEETIVRYCWTILM